MPKHTLKLHDWMDERTEEASLDVTLSDGTVLTIPPPELWPEECKAVLEKQRAGKADDSDLGKLIWGKDGWDAFIADGGTTAAFTRLLIERHQLTSGESSASSSS